ncbi:MAG TPA: hypothetical protein VGM81_10550 [Burkholderiaceae bacterium]|jgi:hypothetical protein
MSLVSRCGVALALAVLLTSWAGLAYAMEPVPDRPAELPLRHLACRQSSKLTSLKAAALDTDGARLLRACA